MSPEPQAGSWMRPFVGDEHFDEAARDNPLLKDVLPKDFTPAPASTNAASANSFMSSLPSNSPPPARV